MTIQETFEKLSSDLRTWIRNNFLNHLTTKNIHRELIEITMEDYNKLGNKVNTDGKVYYIKDGAADVSEESNSILSVKNGGTGASSPAQALRNLGIYGESFMGSKTSAINVPEYDGSLAESTNEKDKYNHHYNNFVTVPMEKIIGPYTQHSWDRSFFELTEDGGIRLQKHGVYMICGSAYVDLHAVSNQSVGKGIHIFKKDVLDTVPVELASAVSTSYNATIDGAVSIAPKFYYFYDATTIYLKVRAMKTTGKLYAANPGTYITIMMVQPNV